MDGRLETARNRVERWAKRASAGLLLLALAIPITFATLPPPAGLDSRAPIGAYLDGKVPQDTTTPWPALLSNTGAFSDTPNRIPHAGLIPFDINSPLWTDAAIKGRFMGLPYDGTNASPTITFATQGAWAFPVGTVIVKNFDMQLNEQTGGANTIRRLETRILVRLAADVIRGATYKWRSDYSDADLLPDSLTEQLTITGPNGAMRTQPYYYPSQSDCRQCHNANAGLLLGIRTAQLNGNITYPSTGRLDNQLNTWEYLGMFNQQLLADLDQYDRMVEVGNTSATLEQRFKSYIASNCSHCHRPGGEGPFYDMRYETAIQNSAIVAGEGASFGGLIRKNHTGSRLFIRDSAPPGADPGPMPPLARNVPDFRIIGPGALYEQFANYPFKIVSASAVGRTGIALEFDRPLESMSSLQAANYTVDGGVTVTQVVPGDGADDKIVVLVTSPPLAYSTNYTVNVNRVREFAAPQNPIWPNSTVTFTAIAALGAPAITVAVAGNAQITLTVIPPTSDGGSPITGYAATCTPPAGASVAGSSVTTQLVITGLTNGTNYSCTARAVNASGTGPGSVAVGVKPYTKPDAPVIVRATPGNGTATIKFSTPIDNGAAISGYDVSCTPGPFVTTVMSSPVVLTNLVNDTTYNCTVVAKNAAGNSDPSASIDVTPKDPPQLVDVFSRKKHGVTDYEILVNRGVNDPLTIEPRSGAHKIVFKFDRAIAPGGMTVQVLNAAQMPIGTAAISVEGNSDVAVTLNGVPDNQRATITLTGVNGIFDTTISIGFLIGDINASRAVNSADILGIKAKSAAVDQTNFRFDLNLSGTIDRADVSMAKARSGMVLP